MVLEDTDPDATVAQVVLSGRYRLGDPLGQGGMATVYRARDVLLDRDVAVKLFADDVAAAADARRARSEMRLLASLSSPHLVTLHDASPGGDGTPAYLVMELVDGSDLGTALASLSPHEFVDVARQVADGLAHVHAAGIVHRDVKPANILITRGKKGVEAKLADLGIALWVEGTRLTAAGTVMGTAAYLSPEQVQGRPVGPATDVYALGLLLLEGLTGRSAFPGTRAESFAARMVRTPPLPAGLAPADAALLAAMTALDPAHRPDASTVAAGLAAWSSFGPFSTGTTGATSVDGVSTADTAELAEERTRTQVLPMPDPGMAADTVAHPPRRRRAGLVVGFLVVLLAAGAGAAAAVSGAGPSAEAPLPTPSYPAVDGTLGEHLGDLQKVIEP